MKQKSIVRELLKIKRDAEETYSTLESLIDQIDTLLDLIEYEENDEE